MNVVITGASKGIGRALTEKFSEHGNQLIVCARTKVDLEKMEKDLALQFPHSKIIPFQCDVSIKKELKNFIDFIFNNFSKVDILINNAGMFINSEILKEEDDIFENTMNTNISAIYYLCKEIGRSMKKNKSGHIFNIGSIAGSQAFVNCGSYTISKFALHGLTKVLRQELKKDGVHVSLVIPGPTYTDSWKGSELPRENFIDPKDIAEMVYAATKLSKTALAEEIHVQPL